MAQRIKTVEYALNPRLTNLATNTTLGTATRYDTPSLTLTLPENTSRTFHCVKLMITWRDAFTVATSVTGWRIGIKLGAVAFSDTDYTTAVANTSDHECSFMTHDVTSYFTTNFGSGTSQTCQVGFAMSSAAASNVNNITIKLVITYEYDDAGLTSEVKTVRIPIQSHHTTLTAAQQEFGTTGGTTNAPANQIPQLTGVGGFLPEGSVTVQRAWIEWWANDAGAATTDFALIYQIDNVTEVTHVTLEQGLNNGCFFHTHSVYDTATHVTSAAHALKARSATTGRFTNIGAVLHVTYTYNPTTTTTVCNSVMFAIGGDEIPPGFINGTTSADQDRISVNLWVPEPATVTLKQSGVLMFVTSAGGGTLTVGGGSQTDRPYTLAALVNSGGYALVHRCDHSSGWTLARGLNENVFDMFFGTAAAAVLNGGFAILNYHSGVAGTGINTHNKTVCWGISDPVTAGTTATNREIATSGQHTPVIPETNYWINRLGYDCFVRQAAATFTINILAEKQGGEHNGDGWYPIGINTYNNDGELSTCRYVFPGLSAFNRSAFDTGGMDVETSRKYRMQHISAGWGWISSMWMTYHSVTFSLTGSVTSSPGGTVTLVAHNKTRSTVVGSTSRLGNGSYTIKVYDNVDTYYVEARESGTAIGRSDDGTPTPD